MNSKWSQSNSWALLGPQPVECHCHPLWLHLRSLVQRQLQAEKSKLWQLPCCVPWCRQVSSDTVAVLERFSGQAAKTEWWQVLGTQEMLFPDLVSNLLGSALWFKFEHTSCEETKMILQFVAHFQLPGMSTAQMVCQNSPTKASPPLLLKTPVQLSFCTWPRWYTQKSSQILIMRFIHARNSSQILVIISSPALSFQSVSCSQNFKTQAEKWVHKSCSLRFDNDKTRICWKTAKLSLRKTSRQIT